MKNLVKALATVIIIVIEHWPNNKYNEKTGGGVSAPPFCLKHVTKNTTTKMETLDRNNIAYKCHFATYLNMAFDNLLMLTSHIVDKYGIKYENGKGDNESGKETNKMRNKFTALCENLEIGDKLLVTKIQDELSRNLPFFQYLHTDLSEIHGQDVWTIRKTIECCYSTLLNCRNQASHGINVFTPTDEQTKYIRATDLITPLKNAFESARWVIKERFGLQEKELYFLKKEGYIVSKGSEKGEKDVFKTVDGNGERLSDVGLVFFTCLFLEKKYVRAFMEHSIFKAKPMRLTEQKIIYEMFSCYRMRQVRERLDCQKPDYALALDMINELHKCPRELFDLVSTGVQRGFRVKSEDSDVGEVLMVRSNDRFPYFAMRYIDEQLLFRNVRFQVALGNYRYKFYMKNCVDGGEPRLRSLQKELNGFGRLQEIEEKRKDNDSGYGQYIRTTPAADDIQTKPYLTDCHAHYVFNANRVGLSLQGDYMPTIDGDHAPCRQPDCWLSTYELPAAIFLHLLGGKPEEIITQHVGNIKRLYQDIINGTLQRGSSCEKAFEKYGIAPEFLPIKIRQFLDGEAFDNVAKFNCHAESTLRSMWNETKRQINVFENRRERARTQERGKKGSEDIKAGWLAQQLAKDIIAMQPSDK